MCSCDLCGRPGRCSHLQTRFGYLLMCQACLRRMRVSPCAGQPYAGADAYDPFRCNACLHTGFQTDEAGRLVLCACLTITKTED